MSCKHESCGHDHDHDGPDRGFEYSLYRNIDLPHIRSLNVEVQDDVQDIFKPWDMKFDESKILSKYIKSDSDEQMVLVIPYESILDTDYRFTGSVKLKSVAVLGPAGSEASPSKMKLFVNRQDIDFDSVDSIAAQQEFELVRVEEAGQVPEYPTRIAKFSNVQSLTIYFPENFGADQTIITYIGLKGEFTLVNSANESNFQLSKDPIITLYEAAANPADHKKSAAQEFSQTFIG